MSNVHGLHSSKDDDDDHDDDNNRFVGGIGDHGGGSGLAVQPNTDEGERDSVFRLAQNASAEDSSQVRRTITMFRDGFTVDDGPYRRLNDPANAEFLQALARGRTPAELSAEAEGGNVVVGLVDKRDTDYQEEFRSFQGQGNSLGGQAQVSSDGTFDPSTLPESPPALNDSDPTTSIQVRLTNGQRRVIRINLSSSVADLAAHLRGEAGADSFRLVSGYPPKPLEDASATVEDAGLKGAQVSMQKAS